MVAHIIGKDFAIKNTATTDSKKYKIIDDRIITSEFSSCELLIAYTGRASEFCVVGDYLLVNENFYQILSIDVDYIEKTIRLTAEANLLFWYSQRGTDGNYGAIAYAGRPITYFLEEFTEAPFPYKIKSNEIAAELRTGDTRASTAKEALENTAALFGVEILLSYQLEGETVAAYFDIKKSGIETNEILTVGKEITAFSKSESCADIVTSVYLRGKVKPEKVYTSSPQDVPYEVGKVYAVQATVYRVCELVQATNTKTMRERDTVYRFVSGQTTVGFYFGDPSLASTNASYTAFPIATGWVVTNGYAAEMVNSYLEVEEGHENEDPEESINHVSVITPLPSYDDGDYFTDVVRLEDRSRLVSRLLWGQYAADGLGVTRLGFGAEIALNHEDIETVLQHEVLTYAIALLNEHAGTTTTYECECNKRVKFNGFYTLAIPEESVYISARCLEIEESETAGTYRPVFGEYLVKTNAFEVMARNAKGGF